VFFLPLIRWLANHHNPRVVLGVGVVLVCAAIAIAAAGIAIHQPAVTRIGVLLMIASIAVFVIRSRRDRNSQRGRTDQ
jgi:Flp pilus assembly protein TadB